MIHNLREQEFNKKVEEARDFASLTESQKDEEIMRRRATVQGLTEVASDGNVIHHLQGRETKLDKTSALAVGKAVGKFKGLLGKKSGGWGAKKTQSAPTP